MRRAGVIAGLVAGPFFLISVGLNSWASIDYLDRLGWEFVGGEQVPWPSSLARGPYGWAQVATFVITGLLIVVLAIAVRDQLPLPESSSTAIIIAGACRPRTSAQPTLHCVAARQQFLDALSAGEALRGVLRDMGLTSQVLGTDADRR